MAKKRNNAKVAVDPIVSRAIDEMRSKALDRSLNEVASAGAKMSSELERDDAAHKARLAGARSHLRLAIEYYNDARARMRQPISPDEVAQFLRETARLSSQD